MFTVEITKPDTPDAEIIVTGELVEGEKLTGRCCPGHAWEVSHVSKHRDDDPVTEHTYWGHCQNPQCPIETGSHWHGVSSHDGFSIAEWMLDHPESCDHKTANVISDTEAVCTWGCGQTIAINR